MAPASGVTHCIDTLWCVTAPSLAIVVWPPEDACEALPVLVEVTVIVCWPGALAAALVWLLAVHIDAGHNPDHACAGSHICPVAKEAGVIGTSLVWPRRCQFPGRGLSGTSKRQPRKRQQRGDESSFGHSDPHSWQTTLCGRVQIYVVNI